MHFPSVFKIRESPRDQEEKQLLISHIRIYVVCEGL